MYMENNVLWAEKSYIEQSKKSEKCEESEIQDITANTLNKSKNKNLNGITPISGVYKIVNRITSKYYIGSAVNMSFNKSGRWYRHKRELIANRHHNPHLQRAWNKYGEDAFEFIILEEINKNENESTFQFSQRLRKTYEQKWLDIAYTEKENVYNNNFLATGGMFTEDVLEKMRQSHIGKKQSQETINKRIAKLTGQKHSKESNRNISIAKKGKVIISEKQRQLSRIYNQTHPSNSKGKTWSHSIDKLKDKTIYTFINITTSQTFTGNRRDFIKMYHLSPGNIHNLIKGNRKSVKGWKLI